MTEAPRRWAALAGVLAALPDPVRHAVVPGRLLADVEAVLAGAVVAQRIVVVSLSTRDAAALPLLWYGNSPYDLVAAAPIRVEPLPADASVPVYRSGRDDDALRAALRHHPAPPDLPEARPLEPVAARYLGWNEARSAVSRRAALVSHAARTEPAVLAGRLRDPAVLGLPAEGPAGPVLTCATLHPRQQAPDPAASGVAALLRAELLDADAVVVAVDYERLVDGDEPLAALGSWIAAAHRVLGPDRVTVAVDGVERSRSTPSNLRAWVVRACHRRLGLPDGWPDDAVVELRSRAAVALLRKDERSTGPARVEAELERTGVPRLMARTTAPWAADPLRAGQAAVHRRLSLAVRDLHRWSAGVLALAERPTERLDPELVLDLEYARRREARLLARGLSTLASRVPTVEP
ncbi:hypothetical protein ABZS66_13990 [Dactylosporangium sp. NPDC005572]|uniref:hypothetical protein n=1 Tax=Dactylosporangium sp. NPDC005572 TaxID=3156889 RepID=UPI0033A41C2E